MPLISRILLFTLLMCYQLAIGQRTSTETRIIEDKIDSLYIEAFDSVQQKDYDVTLKNLKEGKELSRSINAREKLAQTTSMLASVYLMLNNLENASAECVQAIQLQRELKNKDELGKSYLTYATINLQAGDYAAAQRYLTEAETIFLITQDDVHLAQVYLVQGTLFLKKNKPNAAVLKLQSAQSFFSNNDGSDYLKAKTLLESAKAQEVLKNNVKAENYGTQSLILSQNNSFSQIELESLFFLSNLAKSQGNFEKAYSLLHEFYAKQSFLKKKNPGISNMIADSQMLTELDPNGFQAQRRIQASKITTVLVIALFTMLCLLALSLYKNNNLRAKANELLQNKNAQLLVAKENAEKASMIKAQFLSTITHELRTPMYAVTGLTHLLMEESPTDEQKKHLDSLKFSGEYLLSLINNILDLNKLEANKVEVEYTTFNLKKRVDDVIFALSRSAEERGNKLKLSYDQDIPEQLMGDPLMISQILINLIGNANKFTRDGDINVRINQKSETDNQIYLHFEVEDTGEGISKKKQKNIFQNFTQGSVQINRKFGGTGLGLSIVRRLLDLQNSTIDLESTLGKGSKFFFDLKYNVVKQKDLDEHKEKVYDIDYDSLKGRRILVVEDNKINQMITRKILEKNGMDCDVADNGEIAIEKIRFENFDVVLMDIHMPGISGTEATKRVRQFNEGVPILALTAVTIDENIDDFYLAGFTDIIPKPYKVEEFFSKIYKCLKDEDIVS
ncbi:response regulator [Flavimarina sp. Hel_I_48]|uniref:tetratricopeptide repeat-containing hybrid sensor histidine kinase/response regulator n=1 Tax=Flavimarina sp. Hel_I_48 TaxID=1392488 RepID=UPI0004DECCFD|nr:response regulator [Flavimarina sp. Hel_I_48]